MSPQTFSQNPRLYTFVTIKLLLHQTQIAQYIGSHGYVVLHLLILTRFTIILWII